MTLTRLGGSLALPAVVRYIHALVGVLWLLTASLAQAEIKFPPPEFDGGHKLPLTTTPAPREPLLQYVDLAVLAAALAVSGWLVFKQRSRRGLMALSVFSLLYFGFWRRGCICSIGSTQNVALAIADHGYALPITVALFFVLPLLTALFAGRLFCAGVCPHGALQDLVLIKPIKLPRAVEEGLSILPFVYLGAGILYAATASTFLFCQYDPFIALFRLSGRATMVAGGLGLVVVAMFINRPFCRFLCPYGALLHLCAFTAKWRVSVTPDHCVQCRVCEVSCPTGAIVEPDPIHLDLGIQARARRRVVWLSVLLPVWMAAGAYLGHQFSEPAARLNPTVSLAEHYLQAQASAKPGAAPKPSPPPSSVEALALARAEAAPEELLAAAEKIRGQFSLGGWIFGAWLGLVIGAKLISLSLYRPRTDYEPEQPGCFACARCYEYCPREILSLRPRPVQAVKGAGAAPGSA